MDERQGMATIIEKPPDVNLNNIKNVGEVIHLKEAKLNSKGLLEINNAVKKPLIKSLPKNNKLLAGRNKKIDNEESRTDGSSTRPTSGGTTTDNRSKGEPETIEERPEREHSPMSVHVERKVPDNTSTAPVRAQSEYTTTTHVSGNSKYTVIVPGQGQIEPLPTPQKRNRSQSCKTMSMRRIPTRMIRLTTVTMSARFEVIDGDGFFAIVGVSPTKDRRFSPKTLVDKGLAKSKSKPPASRGQMGSLYYEEPRKPSKIITWDEANNSRPPLRIDMEGPGPWSYTPANKPLYETNQPAWSFGSKCSPEKTGGSRTSWEKPWFQSTNIWQQKTDFYSDTSWPTPNLYKQKSTLGPRQRTLTEFPSFSIGTRKTFSLVKKGADKDPSPTEYEKTSADKILHRKFPAFSHQFRRSGTILWAQPEKTPGPAAYSPTYAWNKSSPPSFTIRNMRREKSHVLGPFATL